MMLLRKLTCYLCRLSDVLIILGEILPFFQIIVLVTVSRWSWMFVNLIIWVKLICLFSSQLYLHLQCVKSLQMLRYSRMTAWPFSLTYPSLYCILFNACPLPIYLLRIFLFLIWNLFCIIYINTFIWRRKWILLYNPTYFSILRHRFIVLFKHLAELFVRITI